MKQYIVTLISKDGQKYQTTVESENDSDAVGEAFIQIQRNGWDIYGYKLHQLERIK